jgi:hypothetical protein
MSGIKYIYDEYNKTLETLDGQLFLDCNADIAKFNGTEQAYKYLKENDIYGLIGKRINMKLNNSI